MVVSALERFRLGTFRQIQQKLRMFAIGLGLQKFAAVGGLSDFEFQGVRALFNIVTEHVLLDGLDGLGMSVFPFNIP